MPRPALQSSLLIRDMQLSDAESVSALAHRIWRAHYPSIISREQIEYMLSRGSTPEALTTAMREKNQRYWLIYDDNALSGYAAAQPQTRGEWYIDKLYVDPGRHRSGLGSALFAHIVRELSPKALTLRVNRNNAKAIRFYQKHGFTVTGEDVLDIGGGYVMDDFLMRKDIRS